MKEEPKKTGKSNFKRFLFGVACLITLIALFYAEEDFRGKHDWDSYKNGMAAKGEKTEFSDFLPAPVPDDQNFAMTPVCIALVRSITSEHVIQSWYGDRANSDEVAKLMPLLPCNPTGFTGTNSANNKALVHQPDSLIFWPTGGVVNLKPWQAYYRSLGQSKPGQVSITPQPQSPAADVLLALSKYDPVMEQLRQASQLPGCRFPVQYDIDDPMEILLPHLAAVKGCAGVLELRALAELQNNQADPAFNDVQLMFRLTDSVRSEPFAITYLVRMAMMQMTLQVIYEGLDRHQWSDAQLVEMDAALGKLDYLADFEFSIRSETAAHAKIMDWLEQKPSRIQVLIDESRNDPQPVPDDQQRAVVVGFYTMPKGWFYQGDVRLARATESWEAVGAVNDAQQIISPAVVLQSSNTVERLVRGQSPFNVLGRMLVPEWSTLARRTAYAQASADLARTAVALERYHLAHGEFPDSLEALAPQFIQEVPHDIINGEPLQYRRTSDGQFILYSVGWNGTDDGGEIDPPGYARGLTLGAETGDWVWQYPPK